MFLKLIKPLSFLPAIVLMYLIISLSAQDAETSSALSYRVSYTIVSAGDRILNLNLEPERIAHIADRAEGIIRKCAHVGEYFLLAIAVAFPLYVYGMHGLALMLVAGIFCLAFASLDEFHQSFVEGRSPGARDVLIDSIGIFCGILTVRIIGWTGRMTIFRPFSRARQKKQKDRDEFRQADPETEEEEESVEDDEEEPRPDGDILSEDMSLRKLIRDLTSKNDR